METNQISNKCYICKNPITKDSDKRIGYSKDRKIKYLICKNCYNAKLLERRENQVYWIEINEK